MNVILWDKEKLKHLSEQERQLWVTFKQSMDPSVSPKDALHTLHEITRTPHFMALYLGVEEGHIVASAHVIQLYLEEVLIKRDDGLS